MQEIKITFTDGTVETVDCSEGYETRGGGYINHTKESLYRGKGYISALFSQKV
jgi:hypothetical protein